MELREDEDLLFFLFQNSCRYLYLYMDVKKITCIYIQKLLDVTKHTRNIQEKEQYLM